MMPYVQTEPNKVVQTSLSLQIQAVHDFGFIHGRPRRPTRAYDRDLGSRWTWRSVCPAYLVSLSALTHTTERINLLVPHFLSQNNPDGPVIIATTLCAIINSALKSTTIQGLSPDAIAAFIHQIVGRLPSSSAGASGPLAVLNDAVIDALWSVDTEVDDRLFDAKLAVKNLESQGPSPASKQAEQAAVDAEADKDVMVAVLQKFLVSLGTFRETV